jgi:hypothetical protein
MGYGLQVRSWLSWAPVDGYEGQVGVDVLWALLQADLQVPSLPPLGDPRPPQFDPITVNFAFDGPYLSVAPWISADWEAAPGLRFLPGVRFTVDRYAGGSHLTLDPKLAVRWQVHPAWTIKGMGALAHQAPPVFQVEEPYGDPDIEPIRALQSSLGLEWRPVDGWEITVEGFFNYFDNIARAADRFEAEDGTVQRASFASDVEGRAYGLEVLIRKQLGGFVYGWLSYTLSRTERLFPPDDWRLSTLDQTHVLNLAWSFLLGDGWSIGSRFTLTSGTPVYEPIGARYDADRDRYQPIFSATADRLPVFHRLDLRVDKSWRFDTWILGAYIDVQNVYNAQNPESRRYSFDFRTVSDGLGVPILPTLGVRATF